jgi:hypothetical protein
VRPLELDPSELRALLDRVGDQAMAYLTTLEVLAAARATA